MTDKLANQVAVVTGGGSGIGAEICRVFAGQGAKVAVTDIKHEAALQISTEINASGATAMALAFDVSDRQAVEAAVCRVEQELGPIDIWVNNAGISHIMPFLECSEALWDLTQRINLKGAFICCQAVIRRMADRKRGVILNMSSQSGRVGNSQYAAYCASKFGVIGLTQSLAVEFAPLGIRVNALCPGVVFTPLWKDMVADYGRKRQLEPEEVRPYLESKIPLGRLGTTRDVAQAAVFLVSGDASFITGQSINVSGGSIM